MRTATAESQTGDEAYIEMADVRDPRIRGELVRLHGGRIPLHVVEGRTDAELRHHLNYDEFGVSRSYPENRLAYDAMVDEQQEEVRLEVYAGRLPVHELVDPMGGGTA